MPHYEYRTTKTGQKRIRAHIQVNGERVSRTFESKTDARNWAETLRLQRISHPTLDPRARHTVTAAIDRYLNTKLAGPNNAAKRKDRLHQLVWWQRVLGNIPLKELATHHILSGRDKLLAEKNKRGAYRSEATANRYVAALSAVLSICTREWEWMLDNPCKNLSSLKEPRGRTRVLDLHEIKLLAEECSKSKCSSLLPIFKIAIHLGMRKGEILSLSVGDIDLENESLTIKSSKNGTSRTLPLTKHLLETFRALCRETNDSNNLLFPSKSDPAKPLCIKTAWCPLPHY